MKNVMLIDDEEKIRKVFYANFSDDFNIITFENPISALKYLEANETIDCIVTDIKMPEMTGLEFLEVLSERQINIPVIVMTGYATVDMAVEAFQKGAYNFVVKPFDFLEMEVQIKKAVETNDIVNQAMKSIGNIRIKNKDEIIIGEDKSLKKIVSVIKKVANLDTSVLIMGESGTGKELVAQAIHYSGGYKEKPFIVVNCAAFPENLLESELFGFEKGAFTGAYAKKKGKVEIAEGGTLFLDEIGEIPLKLQAKLLRLIQFNEYERIGNPKTFKADIRIIAATNKNLEVESKNGRFREDLYYRLKVVPIILPPLRNRISDFENLLNYFLKKYTEKFHQKKFFNLETINVLKKYSWPGNIRELENFVRQMVILTETENIEISDLPDEIKNSINKFVGKVDYSDEHFFTLTELEIVQIKKALELSENNYTKASKMLGIDRSTLYRKIKKLGILDE